MISIALLLFGVFIPHSGEFTRFLNRLGFGYLIYYLWTNASGVVVRLVANSSTRGSTKDIINLLEVRQEDSLYFRLFALYSTLVVAIFFYGVAERFIFSKRAEREFPLTVLFIHLGGLLALRLSTFRDLFLALETVTLASYVLVAYERRNRFSTYAGVQYFIVGSIPSALLILSFALLYQYGGSVALQDRDLLFFEGLGILDSSRRAVISYDSVFAADLFQSTATAISTDATSWHSSWPFMDTPALFTSFEALKTSGANAALATCIAFFFRLSNFLFKLTAVPFNFWAPSVYGKAPTASVAFLSIYSKVRVLFLLYKIANIFFQAFPLLSLSFLTLCAVGSVVAGRIGAFAEKTIKRYFVYSSRGHVGFRLIGFAVSSFEGILAVFHYIAVYTISSFRRWFFLLSRGASKRHLTHFGELKVREPLLALLFSLLIFSRSGIPPLGGFFVKLDILAALLNKSHFFINYVLFFFTVASFFYYLRVVKIIFFDQVSTTSVVGRELVQGVDTANSVAPQEMPRYVERIWRRVAIFLVLFFYIFIVQKPLLAIQAEALASLFLLYKPIAQLVRALA